MFTRERGEPIDKTLWTPVRISFGLRTAASLNGGNGMEVETLETFFSVGSLLISWERAPG